MEDKVIITAAITGSIHTPTMSPHLPITPKEIADEAVRAYEAGAAVCHVHARDPQNGRPSSDLNLFKEIITSIKSRCNIIICTTTGGGPGMTPEERVAVVSTYKPELASFNMGSINFSLFPLLGKRKDFKFPWEKQYLEYTEDFIFANTFKSMKVFCNIFNDSGTKPELEVYDVGMINNMAFMIEQGLLKKPVYIQFVLGILGGIAPTIENLIFLYESAHRQIGDFTWSVCAAGRQEMPLCTTGLLMGGNARVGLEDALWVSKGVPAKSNADLVEKIVRIAREFGIEPATPTDARHILGLKGPEKANF